MTPLCTACGSPLTVWSESTWIDHQPDWWPPGVTYDPPVHKSDHTLCVRCGRKTITIEGTPV